jgi:hypothetical protein
MYCRLVVPGVGRGATHEFEACDHAEEPGTAGAPKLVGQVKEFDVMLAPVAGRAAGSGYKGKGDAAIVVVA